MPQRHTDFRVPTRHALRSKLLEYKDRNDIDQQSLADQLGVSQSYLSRILSGERGGSVALLEKAIEIFSLSELGPITDMLDDATELYERGILLFGSGDIVSAEVYFQFASAHRGESAAELDLEAKSKGWLAGIWRDRNELKAANDLYSELWGIYHALKKPMRLREIKLLQGACLEMQAKNKQALDVYMGLLEPTEALTPLTSARLNSRIGALLTKIGDLDPADSHLSVALKSATSLNDPGPYSYASEKTAILRIRQGDLISAHEHLDSAKGEIRPADTLRHIQSDCVMADLEEADGRSSSAEDILVRALDHATRNDYGHQRDYINRRLIFLRSRLKLGHGSRSSKDSEVD